MAGVVIVPGLILIGGFFIIWPLVSGLSLFAGPKSSLTNTEILIDSSLAMDEPFWGGQSKLEFAQTTIAAKLLSQPTNKDESWAIRQFGGPCDGENTAMVLPFAPGNIDEAFNTLGEIQPGGETTFTDGMLAAFDDLSDPELFGGKINAVIGIIGTSHICSPESVANVLNLRLSESTTRILVRVIGMGIPAKERAVLEQTVKAIGGKTYFVGTGLELEEALIEISLEVREVLEEFNEGDGTFLQTPVPLPPPPPTLTPAPTPTPDLAAAVEPPPIEEPASTVESTPTPEVPAEAQPTATAVPIPEPTPVPEPVAVATATPIPEPAPVFTPTPLPTQVPAPTSAPVVVATPTPTKRPPVVISTDVSPAPALPPDCSSQFQPTPPATGGYTLPHVFAGTVTIDGTMPADGIVVMARIDGQLAAVTVTKDGSYTLPVEPPLGISYLGKKVIFSVGECQALPTATWQGARVDRLDLTVTSPR